MKLLSIIVPCFNEENSINLFYNEINETLKNIDINYQILFIDDGSNDNTLTTIKKLSIRYNNIKYISFSRNFGKESAIYAGFQYSKNCDYVVIMDVDLQDPPSLLPEMIDIIQNSNYDIIATRRVSRKGEPIIRSYFARLFYKIINRISNLELADGVRDYRIMTKEVANSILQLTEYNRFSKGLFSWVGFKTKWVEYENIERKTDESSWSFWELVKYSIEGIVAFSTLPLSISTFFGILISIIAFFFMIFIIIRNLLYGDPVQGWASTICIILLLSGIQLFSIGILGKYLEKTYLETKHRPIYIIKEFNID
ncbi:glycosyltransferase family 2 protein [uncultured Methanobrevibacter sp.]|uniref:glycosyltransferase family 2 protein n=1 Tax=uncultured Methanobrevibacter sp. TaxID=253161 RepID=UPI0025D1B5DB|nr:glycosyltransferase family 2 protein [uncultured Methanobrevibacter sp.]